MLCGIYMWRLFVVAVDIAGAVVINLLRSTDAIASAFLYYKLPFKKKTALVPAPTICFTPTFSSLYAFSLAAAAAAVVVGFFFFSVTRCFSYTLLLNPVCVSYKNSLLCALLISLVPYAMRLNKYVFWSLVSCRWSPAAATQNHTEKRWSYIFGTKVFLFYFCSRCCRAQMTNMGVCECASVLKRICVYVCGGLDGEPQKSTGETFFLFYTIRECV